MATILDKELKRQITVDGTEYTVVIDPGGIRLTGKGKRRPEAELRWKDLVSGEAAMAVALNASLTTRHAAVQPEAVPAADQKSQPAPKRRSR